MARRKLDPLIAALIAKLPHPGAEWSKDAQTKWLKLMEAALEAGYVSGQAAQKVIVPKVVIAEPATGFPFVIDGSGFVRRNDASKARILPKDITGPIFDERGALSDLRSIVWADGKTGANGLDLTISA